MTYRDIAEEYAIDALNIGKCIETLSDLLPKLAGDEKKEVENRISSLKVYKLRFENKAKMYGERINR